MTTMTPAQKLQNFGRNNEKLSRGCLCDHDLRDETLSCVAETILLCDGCGRVWLPNARGLLCEIGRREVI